MLLVMRGGRRADSWRLDLVQLATGKRLFRQALDGISVSTTYHDAAKICLQSSIGVECRSTKTLQVMPGETATAQPEPRARQTTVLLSDGSELHLTNSDGLRRSNTAHTRYTSIEPAWKNARFAVDPCRHDAVRLTPESYVLIDEITDGTGKHAEVLRIGPDGHRIWTQRLPFSEVEASRLDAQRLILVFGGVEQSAVALAVDDGHQLWRYPL